MDKLLCPMYRKRVLVEQRSADVQYTAWVCCSLQFADLREERKCTYSLFLRESVTVMELA